jgi:hypothetical protein
VLEVCRDFGLTAGPAGDAGDNGAAGPAPLETAAAPAPSRPGQAPRGHNDPPAADPQTMFRGFTRPRRFSFF